MQCTRDDLRDTRAIATSLDDPAPTAAALRLVGFVEIRQINVGTEIELATSKLPHTQNHEPNRGTVGRHQIPILQTHTAARPTMGGVDETICQRSQLGYRDI